MKSDFLIALTQLAAERNLPREIVLSAIEAALASAYRKDNIAAGQNISVKLDPGTGEVSVTILKTVVDEVSDPLLEITLVDAQEFRAGAELGDDVATETLAHNAGRIAAQTAKQVVLQRLREAERELVFAEYADKAGEIFSVGIQRIEARHLVVVLGRAEAILPLSEQVPGERYRSGQKMRVLLQAVERSSKGPELIVSRADKLLLKRLFEMEVPEIFNGAVEIVTIAREPGSRSKVAVRATQDGVDPVGSCVGLRGVRIQNIVNELQGEKIDVVEWSKDPARFIASALSPSQVMRVELNSEAESAVAVVPERQLSLAIGREGQNARLAAKLTGWSIDIKSNVEVEAVPLKPATPSPEEVPTPEVVADPSTEQPVEVSVVAGPAEAEPVAATTEDEAIEAIPELVEVADQTPEEEKELVEVAAAKVELVDIEPALEPKEPVPVAVASVPTQPEPALVEVPIIEPAAAQVDISPPRRPEPAVPVLEGAPSLRDLSDDVWSIRKAASPEPGRIRFAEDIDGLRGGVTARRDRQSQRSSSPDAGGRRKRPKAARRRR